jgi:hypothetical protein
MQLNRNTDRQPMPKVSKAIDPQVKEKQKQSTRKNNNNNNNNNPSSFVGEVSERLKSAVCGLGMVEAVKSQNRPTTNAEGQ